ncbi:hypothetical protein [Pseudomonas sp. Marseille-Q1929]|uniref:hypothetical protein n=1 Tax=Pseudomonas sp. Marseille-Q1929 TaxID=2730402 RepID=UPI001A8CF751|nr:hypothetical protein [Pseudomonas sp. Marseille-Q1929]MBO0496205.1 hypothetical protein [Pseudomonas sp. Marseille-Q1929]
MTIFNSQIAADLAATEITVPKVSKPNAKAAPQELPTQFKAKRVQHVAFDKDQTSAINIQLDLMEECYGGRITVNHLVRTATLAKARRVLAEGGK